MNSCDTAGTHETISWVAGITVETCVFDTYWTHEEKAVAFLECVEALWVFQKKCYTLKLRHFFTRRRVRYLSPTFAASSVFSGIQHYMHIQYLSDLHLEYNGVRVFREHLERRAPLLILAGDIGDPFEESYLDLLDLCSTMFSDVVFIAGNHEYYHHTIPDTNAMLTSLSHNFNNVTYLDNTAITMNGITIGGATLWTRVTHLTNDIHRIKEMDITIYNKLHTQSCEFIRTLPEGSLVVSHHLPSYRLIAPMYTGSVYNDCFASRNDDLIHGKGAWIYGHTHIPQTIVVDGVPTFCNPFGYPDEKTRHMDINQIVDFTPPKPVS